MEFSSTYYESPGGGGGEDNRKQQNRKGNHSTIIRGKSTLISPSSINVLLIILLCIVNLTNSNEVPNLSSQNQKKPTEIDENLKNAKLIGQKLIPDVSIVIESGDEKFDSLKQFITNGWPTLENDGFNKTTETPFTIIVPKVDIRNIEQARLKDVMLEHLVPGKAFDTFTEDEYYGNYNGHPIIFKTMKKLNESQWTLNDLKVLKTIKINEKFAAVYIDGFLGDRKTAFSKRNIQETNRYNEPQKLEMKNFTKNEPMPSKDSNKVSPLMSFLANMKSGTKVFQHFLTKSNLTQIMDSGAYTILIPSDNAFQRWHPIDWGFYPFSVQEFTENVLRNHFLQSQTPLRMADIKNTPKMSFNTLGGETVVFRNSPAPTVNNVSILADYTLTNGNQIFIISEVLFVSEAVVSKLHQMHKDKETPPLLAFPWFGAQFLSHSYLALEREQRFTQIARYLNNAEIAPHISGANYTFFVPIDDAFEKVGFDLIPDDILASSKGVKMLLNHFVRGRLYDRDLQDGVVLETIGGGMLKIQRHPKQNVTVNQAKIIESEIFVYNLGTMFYIDEVLYSEILREYATMVSDSNNGRDREMTTARNDHSMESSGSTGKSSSSISTVATTLANVEIVPSEFSSDDGNNDEFPLHSDDIEDEIITPKALPVRYDLDPPKK